MLLNKMRIKRTLRRMTGWSEAFLYQFTKGDMTRKACVFYYHRVAEIDFLDSSFDDRNVTPTRFERQIADLNEFAEIVPVLELQDRLNSVAPHNEKPLVSITFDDGFANFHSRVLPLIKKYNVPVTLSVPTGYIGSEKPAPFDRWGQKYAGKVSSECWRIMDWNEVEECVKSGLVTLGSHSHLHLRGNGCSDQEIEDEVGISTEILKSRFGSGQTKVYAYPFGNSLLDDIPEIYINTVINAGYKLALATDVGLTRPDSNYFRLPRLEAGSQDTVTTMRAKSSGVIAPLYLNNLYHQINSRKTKVRRKWLAAN